MTPRSSQEYDLPLMDSGLPRFTARAESARMILAISVRSTVTFFGLSAGSWSCTVSPPC